MKRLTCLVLLFALAGCSLMSKPPLAPAPETTAVAQEALGVAIQTDAGTTLNYVTETAEIWASTPYAAATCGGVSCCDATTGAVNAQCKALAQAISANAQFWAEKILHCLAADVDWACDVDYLVGKIFMICSVFPDPTDPRGNVRFGDIARCLSIEAAAKF